MFADNPFLSAIDAFVAAALPLFGRVNTAMFQGTNGEVRVEVRCYLTEPPSAYGYFTITFSYDAGDWQMIVNQRDSQRLGLEVLQADEELQADWADDCDQADEESELPDVAMLIEGRFDFPHPQEFDQEQLADELEEIAFRARSFGSSWPEAFVEVVEKRSLRARSVGGPTYCPQLRVGFEAFMPLTELYSRNWAETARDWYTLSCDLAEAGVGERPPAPTFLY